MKQKLFLFASMLGFGVLFAQDPVLMEINGKPVTKSEFEYIYNKNNTNNSLDKKTLSEYVELFVNFKLKVEEAKTQGIDTTQAFISELNSYRVTLTKPYFDDPAAENVVMQQAYERMKEDINASHILVTFPQNATAADTLAAWEKINTVYKRITGTPATRRTKQIKAEDFEKVAREISDDRSVVENGGHIGWISAFNAVYPFELAAYATPAGEISKPFRTQFGYHIAKVNDRRNSQGEVLTAHIMIRTAPDNDSINAAAKVKINSIYAEAKQGKNFGELAEQFSEDQGSADNGGELPWFGTGRMIPAFETAAFALKNVGDISEPIESAYGWHIIKLLGKKEVADFETLKPDIKRNIQRDERANAGKKSFIEKTKKETAFTANNENLSEFSTLLENKQLSDSTYLAEVSKLNKPFFTIAGKTGTQADFAKYLKANNNTAKAIPGDVIADKFTNFSDEKIIEHADSKLEGLYPDFKLLIQEYHDGILLFEVNNREVWDKASKDTEGLSGFFTKNSSNYKWDKPRFKGRVTYCKDETTLKVAKNIVKKSLPDSIDKTLRTRLNDSIQYVKTERGLYAVGDNKAVDVYGFKNKNSDYTPAEDFPFAFVTGKILKKPENYSDVRGQVTTDYQNFLEEEWIKTLRAKYPVKINEEVLKTIKEN